MCVQNHTVWERMTAIQRYLVCWACPLRFPGVRKISILKQTYICVRNYVEHTHSKMFD